MENNLTVMNIDRACVLSSAHIVFSQSLLGKDYELNAIGNMASHYERLEYIFIIITCKSCPTTPPACTNMAGRMFSFSSVCIKSTKLTS